MTSKVEGADTIPTDQSECPTLDLQEDINMKNTRINSNSNSFTEKSEPKPNSFELNWRNFNWRNFTNEPVLFVYMFTYALVMTPTTNLYMDRACSLTLNYSEEICKNLKNHTDVRDDSQIIANNYNLYLTLIKVVPSALLSVYIGPWSDKYGRLPPIYVSLVGNLIFDLGMVLYVTSSQSQLYNTLLYAIPHGLTGGKVSILSCVYTLATENTKHEYRTIKYAVLELSFGFGIPLGILTSGLIYGKFGYLPIFILAFILHVIILVYAIFVIKDESPKKQASAREMINDFFSLESLKDNFRTAFKKRDNHGRIQICLLCLSMSIIVLSYISVGNILYLYCNKMFNWEMPTYSVVSTVGSVVTTVIMLTAVPLLTRVFKMSDQWLGLVGVISQLAQAVVRAFSVVPWVYYLGLAVGVMGSVAPLAIRSQLSKIVQKQELGKLFSVLAVMESLIPVPGAILYTQVYNASIRFYPGLAFLVGGATILFPFIVFLWLVRLPNITYQEIKEDSLPETENPQDSNIQENKQ